MDRDQGQSETRRNYDILYGHLIGLETDTAAKSVLLRALEYLYERILYSQESALPAESKAGHPE